MPRPLRYDRYGRPLSELADVREAITFDHETNQRYRQLFARLVEDCWHVVCRRGWHGDVRLTIGVNDGILQRDMRAGLERTYRPSREEPPI